MKDYGNAGALCGALGCMALLIVSMAVAKSDDAPETENTSAEISVEETDSAEATGSSAMTTVSSENVFTEETQVSTDEFGYEYTDTDLTDITDTASAEVSVSNGFVGPYSKEMMERMEADSKYSPEVLHLAYPDNLSIVGDSIASGFGVYGVLDNSYDFATGNLGARSITDYSFSYHGDMGTYDAVIESAKPGYIYLSMGMNDVNIITSDEYVEDYRKIIDNVIEKSPDSVVIVAAITPVSAFSDFTANSSIQMFNDKLKALTEEYDPMKVRFFNTWDVVYDEISGGLREDCNGGDGIHLSGAAYQMILDNLYPILDEMPIPQSIKDYIDKENLAALTTAAEGDEFAETVTETVGETVAVEME